MPSQQERDSQAYPQRKRLKYKKDCPWEVEENLSDHHKPYLDLTPEEWAERKAAAAQQNREAAPRIRIALLVLYLFMFYAVGNNLFLINVQRDGWISTIIGGAIHLAILCVPICGIFSILKEMLMQNSDES